ARSQGRGRVRLRSLRRPARRRGGRASLVVMDAAAFDYDRYVGLLVDEAIEHNKQHPKTYTAEEVKAEMRRRAEEKLAGHDL
ncbi:MAG: hypothetical protein ACLU0V_03285, partial [Eggerthella lenta]